MDKYDLCIERNYQVYKSNTLIQKAHYNLSLQEQKVILYVIRKIKPEDTDFQEYEFDLKELCEICGIEMVGANYSRFKDSISRLAEKTLWLKTDKKEILCHWINEVEIDKNSLMVKITISKNLKPYLINLKENFTAYALDNILPMKSKYSIRIYELLKSYFNLKDFIIDLNELKCLLEVQDKYTRYNNFKVFVLDLALDEINKYTDLEVSYKPIRQNRNIVSLAFTIKEKSINDFYKSSLTRAIELNNERNKE